MAFTFNCHFIGANFAGYYSSFIAFCTLLFISLGVVASREKFRNMIWNCYPFAPLLSGMVPLRIGALVISASLCFPKSVNLVECTVLV